MSLLEFVEHKGALQREIAELEPGDFGILVTERLDEHGSKILRLMVSIDNRDRAIELLGALNWAQQVIFCTRFESHDGSEPSND